MNSPVTLVLPLQESLIQSFCNYQMVVKLSSEKQIRLAIEAVSRQNKLESLWIQNRTVMSDISFHEDLRQVPVVYHVEQLGDFKKLANSFGFLRESQYQFFFTLNSNNCTSVQVLSSLGIRASLDFTRRGVLDWDKLTDLAVYAAYNKIKHAPIEPFSSIIKNYEVNGYTFYENVYLCDPQRYLHLNDNGEVAFSEENLAARRFCNVTLDKISELPSSFEAKKARETYRAHLLDFDVCSTCEAFRICKGIFYSPDENHEGCQMFFLELMDMAEKMQQKLKEQ